MSSKAVIVIPARLASQRLPRKMLLRETGKSLVQHTYEQAAKSTRSASLVVAADAEEIADDVRSFGGKVVMTAPTASAAPTASPKPRLNCCTPTCW